MDVDGCGVDNSRVRLILQTQAETDELLSEHEMNLNGKRALNLDQLDVTDVKTSTTVAAP